MNTNNTNGWFLTDVNQKKKNFNSDVNIFVVDKTLGQFACIRNHDFLMSLS